MEQMKPRPRPEEEIDVSPNAEAGDQFFVEQAERDAERERQLLEQYPLKPMPRPEPEEQRTDVVSEEYTFDGAPVRLPVLVFKDGGKIAFQKALDNIVEAGNAGATNPYGTYADGSMPFMEDLSDRVTDFIRQNNPTRQEFETYWYNPQAFDGGFLTKADGMKGRSEEDKDIADEVEQVDVAEADRDEDGFVSPSEREVQLALQKNELVEEEELEKMKPVEAYHGGMMSACDGGPDCTCGMDDPMVSGYDEVSGNPIPIGSSAENVRDDIPANLSEDEYVLPAHVVKWHGLKHIMEMQSEAEMGLMSMEMSGLIHEVYEEESDSEGADDTEVQASDDTKQEEAETEGETSEEIPSEMMDVEVAAVEVDDHLDDEDEELYPMSQPLPAIMKKQKIVFAV
tara:strand:+ start:189 stop:1382 length:1194 start_codon:yes stop_codon:yes gene_type:complete